MAAIQNPLALQLMQMCTLTYLKDPSLIKSKLEGIGNGWTLSKDPYMTPITSAYMYYLAKDGKGNIAVVIRGSVISIAGLPTIITDLDVEHMTVWKEGMKVGTRAFEACQLLIKDMQQSLKDYQHIYVTGHSLGSALAMLVATKLKELSPEKTIIPITFAGESVVDQGFIDYFNGLFPFVSLSGGRCLYWNTYDVVPHFWWNLEGLKNLYPGSSCPSFLLELSTVAKNKGYAQISSDAEGFDGREFGKLSSDFLTNMAQMHSHDTYLKAFGGLPLF